MIKRIRRWFHRETPEYCQGAEEQQQQDAKDAEVERLKQQARKRLHEQAQRVHYLEIASDVERIRSTKKDQTS